MRKSKYSKEMLQNHVDVSQNWSTLLTSLGLTISGGNHRYIKNKVREHGIKVDHFKKGDLSAARAARKFKPDSEVFVENSTYKTSSLYRRLINIGWKDGCSECGLPPYWNGKPLRLHVDHINGISNDHRLLNLRILCPNCHAQTETYSGKNRSIAKKSDNKLMKIDKVKIQEYTDCLQCKEDFLKKKKSQRFCSSSCSNKYHAVSRPSKRKVDRPSKQELNLMIETMPWTRIGRRFGVSDNAVRKWARSYGLI